MEAIEAANNLLALLPPAALFGAAAASIVQTPSDADLSFDYGSLGSLGDASPWSLTPVNPALSDALFLPPATPTTAAPATPVPPTPPAYVGAFGDTPAPPDWASADLQTSLSAPVAPAAPTGTAAASAPAAAPGTNPAAASQGASVPSQAAAPSSNAPALALDPPIPPPPGPGGSMPPSNPPGGGPTFNAVEGGLANSYPSGTFGVNPILRGVEGTALSSVTTTTFNSADPNASVGDYSAVIAWGDGATSVGTVSAAASGAFAVAGSHTYIRQGNYTVTTSVTDLAAATSHSMQSGISGYATAAIADAPLSAAAIDFRASAGMAANVTTATFTDADPNASASYYQASIAWGDGSTSAGTVAAAQGGGFSVTGSHTYSTSGVYQAATTITDTPQPFGGQPQTVVSSATVSDPTFTAGAVNVAPAVEGGDSQLTATFSDGQMPTAPSPSAFTATIAWGDGSSGSATIVQSNGAFQVSGDHTYLVAASYTPTVTITDAAGDVVTESATTAISDVPLSATGATAYAGVNSPANIVVATFTDADPNAGPSSYTTTINWADGTSSAGVVAGLSGVFTVSGNHVFTTTGPFAPTATIQDVSSSATATGSVVVSTVTATAQPASASKGVSSAPTLATFTDVGAGLDTAVIDWGDGTPTTTGAIAGSSGNYTVSGSHNYALGGNYVATVTITTAAGQTSVVAVPATVTDGPLSATGTNISAAQDVDSVSVVVATFTAADPNATASDFSATIDWGDGSGASFFNTVTWSGNSFTVTGDHTYTTQGLFTITTKITDGGGTVVIATSTATVAPTPITFGQGPIFATEATIQATEGVAANNCTVATFAVGANVSTATIDWGDGSEQTAGTIGNGSVYGNHTYAEVGTYAVSVVLTDVNGNTDTAWSTGIVADAPLSAGSVTLSAATEGQAFSGQVVTFTDTNPNAPASDFTATIDWGNGTSTEGTISGANGSFTVSGSNTYLAAGPYAVAVTVTDADGVSVVVSGTPTVADAALSGTAATLNATAGDALNGVTVATFTDSYSGGVATDYTASIDWGDGTTTAGVVEGSDGAYGVRGSHTYAAQGTYTLVVTLIDPGGSASVTGSAQVSPVPVYGVANFGATYPDYPNTLYSASDFTATIDWGDYTAPTPGIVTGAGSEFHVSASHSYAEEGTYNVTVTVTGPSFAETLFSTASVAPAGLIAADPPPTPASTSASTPAPRIGIDALDLVENVAFTGEVASFTDPAGSKPASNYMAAIGWGDGQTSSGTIQASGGAFIVSGAHTYADEGDPVLTVAVAPASGAIGTAVHVVLVAEEVLAVPSDSKPELLAKGEFEGGKTQFFGQKLINQLSYRTGVYTLGDAYGTGKGIILDYPEFVAGSTAVNGGKLVALDKLTTTLGSGMQAGILTKFADDTGANYYWHQQAKIVVEGKNKDKLPPQRPLSDDPGPKYLGVDFDKANKELLLIDSPMPVIEADLHGTVAQKKDDKGNTTQVRLSPISDDQRDSLFKTQNDLYGDNNAVFTYSFVDELVYDDGVKKVTKGQWEWGFTVKFVKGASGYDPVVEIAAPKWSK